MLAPSAVPLRDTGLDQNRVACAVEGFSVGTRGLATIDAPNFYGTLSASLMLDYRYLHAAGFEFSVGARLLDYRFAQSAVFTEGDVSVGPVSVGVLRPKNTRWWGIPVAVGHSLRFEIPYTNSSDGSLTVAASPAYLVTLAPSSKFHIHARVASLLWSVVPEAGADSRAALLASSDIAYSPASIFSVTTGAEVQAGWYGLGLDHVQARAGLRTAIGKSGALELAAATTLAGAERNDLVFWIGYRSITVEEPRPKRSRLRDWANQL
tara:strand:- start:3137 stop:3931 length:795 start_codon:yes stop_codon:yes gene_type:complete